MKKTIVLCLGIFAGLLTMAQSPKEQIQIDTAFGQSFATQQNQLEPLIDGLKQDEESNTYWIAYANLHASIFLMQSGEKEKAQSAIDDAIDLLEMTDSKNSEEFALQGYCIAFSIALNPVNAPKLGAQAEQKYRKALKLNENNMRAYMGLGEGDFYKPKEYGGGQKVEEYLLKAIALPEQSAQNGPNWGKNSAYHTLVQFYLRENQIDQARLYCMQGLSKFPQDHRLNSLKASL